MLLLVTYRADHNEILLTSRQQHCRGMCKMSLVSVKHMLNQSTPNFYRISNSIEIPRPVDTWSGSPFVYTSRALNAHLHWSSHIESNLIQYGLCET